MVNLVEQTGTDTTTTKPRSPSPPAEPATDVSNLQTSLFPSTVPTVAEANAADSRFPLFLDQPASSSAPDSDNDDRIPTNDPAGDDGDDDDDDPSGKRTHQDSALDRPRETRRVRSAISPVFLNGAVKKRCLRPPQATNALASEPLLVQSDEEPAETGCEVNGVDREPHHDMTSTVAAVTAAANKAVAALMQYRQQQQQQQQQQSQQASSTVSKTTNHFSLYSLLRIAYAPER
uniref:Uncharacterized protein n=1 Tax=Anopheles merus TaxID=30066 RepID=A0A182UNY6_ANOME